jgi:hypothetical protein
MATIPGVVLSDEATAKRDQFFEIVFHYAKPGGYICIARRVAGKGAFEERFFKWPFEREAAGKYIQESVMGHDIWFCPMTFETPERKKEHVDICPSIWADLDACSPDLCLVPPTVSLESSTGRWQALWILHDPADPVDAEETSKRIAYFHAEQGADKSGWDLTQLLRLPLTLNYKYSPPFAVHIHQAGDNVGLEEFNVYPVVSEDAGADWPFPETIEDAQTLLERYKHDIDQTVWPLIQLEPEADWSKALWNLEMLLCESDLAREDIFSIVRGAACNKYRRDGRSDKLLWKEVCKAWAKVKERNEIISDATVFKNPNLLSDGDLAAVAADRTFIEEYIDWAKGVGDAAHAYHQAGAFVCLSGLLAGRVTLPTSYGLIVPNLWFLLLADTTLTRKSTALDLAIELLLEVDPDVILATDGSIEGLFSALSFRPGQPSIFLRDEFSGLVEMMTRRDYYAGMAETLTKLYDGKFQKRQLRREVIEVRDPVLILFAGGIKTKLLGLLDHQHVSSGFLPRFIFITAKSNLSLLRPLGPPSQRTLTGRDGLIDFLKQMRDTYQKSVDVKIGNTINIPARQTFEAELTPGAWELYNVMEMRMLESGVKSIVQDMLTPTMDRLAKSGLKAAVLIAASRMKERVVVEEQDILKAFSYVIGWREYAMEVIAGIGSNAQEHQITLIFEAIRRNPGVLRSTLMQNYHLTKREADNIFDTLEQRGLINRARAGRSERLTALT